MEPEQPDLPGLPPHWRSPFPREGSPKDRKLAHLTLKLNLPASWIEAPTAATALEMDVACCKALREAVEAYRASWATTPAPEPEKPLQHAPVPAVGVPTTSPTSTTNYEECLSCQ